MERGKRYNEGKRRWSLIDHRVLEPLVDVMESGAKKYGDRNYQLGMPIVEIMDSLQRHLVEFRDHGKDLDEESKMHHGAHILSNAYILMYNILFHPDMDNRVNPEKKSASKDEVNLLIERFIENCRSNVSEPPKIVEPMPKYDTGILKGISPEQFLKQENQNARIKRNS